MKNYKVTITAPDFSIHIKVNDVLSPVHAIQHVIKTYDIDEKKITNVAANEAP